MKGLGRHATTLVLVALAIAALVLVLVDRGSVSTREAEGRKQNLFPAWREDEVTEVTLTTGGRVARISREPASDGGTSRWSVTIDGATYPADEQTVDDYLGRLQFAVHERRVASGSIDRAAFQLDAPRTTVAVRMGALSYRLAIGGAAATGPDAAYAEIGDAVYVITSQLASALEIAPDRLRSRTLMPYFSTDLAGLWLDGDGGARHLARAPWGGSRGAGWRFDDASAERGRRVSAVALDRVLTALGLLQAEGFLPEAEAARAAEKRVTLTLIPADGARPRGVIELGGPCPASEAQVLAVRREPTHAAACVPKGVLEALSVPAADLVDRRLLAAPADEVTEVRMESGGNRLEMARASSGWHLRAPVDRQVAADAGRGFVEALLDLEAQGFVSGDPAELGLASPRATVRLVSAIPALPSGAGEAERVEVLELGAVRGELAFVRRVEDGAVVSIPKDRARQLLPDDLALRPRQVIDEPLKRFRSLRIEDGARVQELEREPAGGWRLVRPSGDGLFADIGLATDAASALSTLTAERWVAAEDDGSFGLDPPRVVIEAVVGDDPKDADPDAGAPPTRRVRVLLGAPTSRGSFARLDGDRAVFVAPPALEAAAGRWLVDRGALMVDPARLSRATLAAGGRRVAVVRAGEALEVEGGRGDPSSARRAAAIRDALADLVAEGVATVGKPSKHERLEDPILEIAVERTGAPPMRVRIGARDAWRGASVHFARRDGVAATYALAEARVRALLDAM